MVEQQQEDVQEEEEGLLDMGYTKGRHQPHMD
jgi:hypothetical protein